MPTTLETLEYVYKIVHITILSLMLIITTYCIAYRLRFRLERPALLILCA